jgi:hypothetical protein
MSDIKESRFKKGQDIGKPGMNFKKIADSAAKRYGSKEAGNRVAGAIEKKILAKEDTVQEMSAAQMKDREHIVKSMKKNYKDFRQRYGDKAKSVMYATATKQAMKEDEDQDTEDMHHCAKHVFSDLFGEGFVLEGQHADPDEDGNIDWYMVEFNDGIRKIPTHKLDIMVAEYHMNHKPKKKKMMEEEELDEARGKQIVFDKPAKHGEFQNRGKQTGGGLRKLQTAITKRMTDNPEDKKKMMEEDEVAEANDGNLANNYPPYDKVTKGDVIAGRLGKDQEGGKNKFARERSKYQSKGAHMGPAEMLAKLKGMK